MIVSKSLKPEAASVAPSDGVGAGPLKLLYNRSEAAKMLSISLRTLDTLLASKQLAARRIGKRVLITNQSLLNFVRRDHRTPKKEVQ